MGGEAGLVGGGTCSGGGDLLRGWDLCPRAERLPLLGVLLQMGLYLMVGLVSKGPNLLWAPLCLKGRAVSETCSGFLVVSLGDNCGQ